MAAGRKQQQRVSSSVVALVALLVVLAAAAAAPRAGAARVCNVETSSVMACASYCKNGSQERSPSQRCCSATRGVDIKCACRLAGAVPNGYSANRAMEIPSKCGFGPSNPCG